MFHASIFALILQCGTTAAATIIIIFTPTAGLGCRSLGYIIYGTISILIMFLNIISTVLAWISETRKNSTDGEGNSEPPGGSTDGKGNWRSLKGSTDDEGNLKVPQESPSRFFAIAFCKTSFFAIAFRKISFLLALMNGTGLILLSCLQFTSLLENCYCNASVLGRGVDSYITISYNGSATIGSRIFGTVLSGAVMIIYTIFIWLIHAEPGDIDDASPDDTDDASPGGVDHV